MSIKLNIIERQNNVLRKLNDIAAISEITPKETLRKALEIAKEYFGLEFGIVSHIVGEDYTINVQSSPPSTLQDDQCFALGSTYCNTTLEIDDILAITDVTSSKYIGHPCHKDFNLISYIGAPIRVNSQIYGTINFSSAKARKLEYDEIDDDFMRLLARWAGSFLERQFALDKLSLTKKQFETLFENNASGILAVDTSCHISMVNKRFCEIIGFSKEELIGKDTRMFYTDDISYQTAKEKISNIDKDLYLNLEYQLKRKDNTLIWCEFIGSQIELTKHDNTMLFSIVDTTAQKKMQERLVKQATTDYLTDLYNRRYFASRLEEELFRVKRNQKNETSLIMFDLDRFKLINDTYGHVAGDIVLKNFANILKKYLRKTDIAGRIGGEEFAMIAPNTRIENAVVLANRIREEISNETMYIDKNNMKYTVSIGVTTLSNNDATIDTAYSRADSALYLAKEKGRNRVEVK